MKIKQKVEIPEGRQNIVKRLMNIIIWGNPEGTIKGSMFKSDLDTDHDCHALLDGGCEHFSHKEI